MTDSNISHAELAEWLRPASVELEGDRLGELAAVVAQLTDELEGRELDAVRVAHGRLSDEARVWAAGVVAERAPTAKPADSGDLLSRLVAAAVRSGLEDSESGMLCALAVESARFLGLQPLIASLPVRAVEVLAESGRAVRQRPDIAENVAKTALGSLPRGRKPNAETGEPVNVNDLAEDVNKQSSALRALVEALDDAFEALADRQASLDEEVEMLWWALRSTDDAGSEFARLDARERAVRAASELADRTELLPGPPSAQPLLARVLGEDAGQTIAVGDLVLAVSEHLPGLTAEPDALLPLFSAAAEHERLGTPEDDSTWKTVAERTLGVDLGTETTLAAGAGQVYRELLLERLLTADE